jgi:hypothetical protein
VVLHICKVSVVFVLALIFFIFFPFYIYCIGYVGSLELNKVADTDSNNTCNVS